MPNYSKTIIYKICCNDTNIKDIYVGSTCNFRQRKYKHNMRTNQKDNQKYNNTYVYRFIRDNGGWNNWSMIQLEEVECKNKREKEKYEREWYDKLKPTLNQILPYITAEEKKENHIKYSKIRYQNNKETIKEKVRKYKENNKEKILKNSKEYYENNKEKIKEKVREYNKNNKEEISKKRKERVKCPKCNKELSRSNLSRHLKKSCKKN